MRAPGAHWTMAQALGIAPLAKRPAERIALVGESFADIRDVMIEGVSGLLAVHKKTDRPSWSASRRKLVWPNGAVGLCFSSEDPESLRGPQFAAAMMGLFGVIALLLSVVGIFALVRHYVAQRRQEIGVRMALGAQAGDVVRLTVRQAAIMAGVGIAIGAVAAYAVSQLLEATLMGMAQNDPRLLAGFSAVLAVAALTAAYLPARRAAAIDPTVAMRGE